MRYERAISGAVYVGRRWTQPSKRDTETTDAGRPPSHRPPTRISRSRDATDETDDEGAGEKETEQESVCVRERESVGWLTGRGGKEEEEAIKR